jgi:hypothetical protein
MDFDPAVTFHEKEFKTKGICGKGEVTWLCSTQARQETTAFNEEEICAEAAEGGRAGWGEGTYGLLLCLLKQFTRASLLQLSKFNEHTTFLLCEPDKCVLKIPQEDSSEPTTSLVIPMSSENLLLNACRQQTSAFPACTKIDTTHQLIVEGLNILLIGTIKL